MPGRVYQFFLNGERSDRSDPTNGYSGKFCLASDGQGATRVINITPDMAAWRESHCR